MAKNHLNHYKGFMLGTGILAFAVLLIVVIFLMLGFRMQQKDKIQTFDEVYNIELAHGFSGKDIVIYLNDSVLYEGLVKADSIKMQIRRFAEENALIVNTRKNDKATVINLSEDGGNVMLTLLGDSVAVTK